MYTITAHQTGSELNKALIVTRQEDDCHHYMIQSMDKQGEQTVLVTTNINFQKLPVESVGINGISDEVLLAIVIDRLEGWQQGEFACPENALALQSIQAALAQLKSRTQARFVRGVLDSMQP